MLSDTESINEIDEMQVFNVDVDAQRNDKVGN
jgi:hypothetical protein